MNAMKFTGKAFAICLAAGIAAAAFGACGNKADKSDSSNQNTAANPDAATQNGAATEPAEEKNFEDEGIAI